MIIIGPIAFSSILSLPTSLKWKLRKDIINLCRAHIEYSYEYDNLDHLFSPAPKDVWAEYLTMAGKEDCNVETRPFDDAPHVKSFSAQEIYCYA